MAHKKGAGSSSNGRESHSKRLGIKKFGSEIVKAGNIIVRQKKQSNNNKQRNGGYPKFTHKNFLLM